MKYCTNCGKENSKRICTNCGAKQNSIHKFCGWCGTELNQNAFVCPNCKERIKTGKLFKFFNIVSTILVCFLAFMTIIILLNKEPEKETKLLFTILSATAIFLITPFTINLIQVKFKKPIKPLIHIARILVIMLFAMPLMLANLPESAEPQTIEQRACTEAVEVFHKNVRLKNESSFQLNSYNVKTYDEVYQGNENLTRYFVTLNYSAQNGFGGNSTDTYEVVLLYNNEDDTFTTLSAGE